jgi:transposase
MKKKRTYSAEPLSKVELNPPLLEALKAGCLLSIDVAKEKFVVALVALVGERVGDVVRLLRFSHPVESPRFLALVEAIQAAITGPVVAAMEPTGTYGDALRYQLTKRQVRVFAIPAKSTFDTREVFDGVPSLHDGKSAVQIARVFDATVPTMWRDKSDEQRELRALVDRRRLEDRPIEVFAGRIEALLARHWPELALHIDIHQTKTALELLAAYAGPARVTAAGPKVRELVRRASFGGIAPATADEIVSCASSTLGVPMLPHEEELLRAAAQRALEHWRRADAIDREIDGHLALNPKHASLRRLLGAYTTGVLVAYADPSAYECARALEKACGLNLKEKSSGMLQGRLSLTKRGPGIVRQVLYMAALRAIQSQPVVRAWYTRRRSYAEKSKQRAIVAVMRKLIRAAWHVARGSDFVVEKLFDVRRLDLAKVPDVEKAPERAHGRVARATTRHAGNDADGRARTTRQASFTPMPE